MVSLKPVQFLYPLIRSSWRMTSSMMKYNGTEIVTREKKKLVHKISDTRGPHMSTLLVMGMFGIFWKKKQEDEKEEGEEEEDEEENGLKVPTSVKRTILRAEKARQTKDYNEAEKQYHEALKILNTHENAISQPFIEARAVVLDHLGNTYFEKGDWNKAAVNLATTISLLRVCGVEEESNAIVEISLKISKAYANLKWSDKAGIGFQWCVDTALKIVEKDPCNENLALLGMCQQAKGQHHLMLGDGHMAYTWFSRALDTAKTVYGEKDPQIAVVTSDCATALDAVGNYKEAEKLLEKAIEIVDSFYNNYYYRLTQSNEEYHEQMSTLLMNLAAVRNNQGKQQQAMDTYDLALKHTSKLSKNNLQYEIKRRKRRIEKIRRN